MTINPTSTSPAHDPSVKVENPRGCGALVILVLIAVGSFLLWRNCDEILPWASRAVDVAEREVRDFEEDLEPRSTDDEEPKSARLDSGQVIVGDFQIRTIEEIWAEGDVVGTMSVAIEKDPAWLRRLLEDEGVDPNLKLLYQGGDGWSHPLEKAVRQGSQETFEILLAAGSDPNGQTSNGYTALHEAARKGFRTPIEQLLAAGADPNLAAEGGGTPIESAARNGNLEEMEVLLEGGAEILFALHAAGWDGHVEIIRFLLDLGADPERLTEHGDSALRGAADDEHLEATELLLAAGVRPCEMSLRKAARGGHDETLRAYAQAAVRFDVPPAYWDALYTASHAGQADTVRLLLELGASPHAGQDLDAPINAAITQGHDEVVAVLVAAGAKPSTDTK